MTAAGPRPPRIALLSFRQPFADAVLDGRKRHEFRRGAAGFAWGDLLLIYETAPVSRVIGDAPDAVTLQVDAVHRLPEPVPLAALGLDRPPRSYRWLPEGSPVPASLRDGLAALRRPG